MSKKKVDSLSGNKATVETVAPKNPPAETKPTEASATPAEAPKTEPTPAPEAPKTEEPKPVEPAPAATPAPEAPKEGQPAPVESAPANGESFEALFPEPHIGTPPSWLWWVVLLIISVVLGVVGFALAQKNLKSWLNLGPTASPSASASANASASPTADATATPTPTDTPTPAPTVDPAAITIRVLNGTTTAGEAAKVQDILKAAGISVRSIGNAKTQTYDTTMIYYAEGRLAEAQKVQSVLTGYTATLEQSTLADPDMVLVVIGKK